jgi:hypothetical protein
MIWRYHFVHSVPLRTSPVAVRLQYTRSLTQAGYEAANIAEVVRQERMGNISRRRNFGARNPAGPLRGRDHAHPQKPASPKR